MPIIGLDLALTSAHKAVVMNESGQFLGGVVEVHTWPEELAALLARARDGSDPATPVQVVMEPTGHAWLPVAAYLLRQPQVTVFLVNSQQVADLRKYYHKHAKSDRIDGRVLAKLPLVSPEKLHPLRLPSADLFSLQRACKQLAWVIDQITALTNQLLALDRLVWLGGWSTLVFGQTLSPAARWGREHFYHPAQVLTTGAPAIQQQWQASGLDPTDGGEWAEALVKLAGQVLAVYGQPPTCLDFEALQAEVVLRQCALADYETQRDHLRLEVVRPLYRRLHPSRHLESLMGVGQDSAAVWLSFIGDPNRFANGRVFRGWSGLVPRSRQSADYEGKGLHLSQAGPSLIKKFAYLDAEVARRHDPQLAKLYYDQMVHKGKHHTQAVCVVATHLLDRVRVVLQEGRPYELRDVDGTPVTAEQARHIIAERYTVPDDVRQRNKRRARRTRLDERAERQTQRAEKREGKRTQLARG